jgi:hypothetical protein
MPPVLEFDALRVMFADQGSVEDLLTALRSTNEFARQMLEQGVTQTREALAT